MRWLHALAAAAWVGGSLFYLIVLIPTLKRVPDVPRALSAALGVEFRTVVVTSIIVLVATGAILAFDRLTEVEPPYAATLGVKVVLSIWMFALVRDRRRHARILDAVDERPPSPATLWGKIIAAVSGYNTLVILGVAIFFLSDLLNSALRDRAPHRIGVLQTVKPSLLDILVCPLCKGELTLSVDHETDGEIVSGSLHCDACDEAYPIEDTIPNMLPPELRN